MPVCTFPLVSGPVSYSQGILFHLWILCHFPLRTRQSIYFTKGTEEGRALFSSTSEDSTFPHFLCHCEVTDIMRTQTVHPVSNLYHCQNILW